MRDNKLTIEELLNLLTEAPRRIAAMTDGLTPASSRAAPNSDEWSVNDVLAHLRACADVWGRSIETMVREDHPTIRAISPRTWIHDTDYVASEFGPSMDAYTRQRAELLALLETLPPEDWERGATFTGAGRLLERTVLSEASAIVNHERPHIKQIEHIVSELRFED